MRPGLLIALLSLIIFVSGNTKEHKHRIAVDLAHKEIFWHDPDDMPGMDTAFITRMRYMTGELTKTAAAVNADFVYLKKEIKTEDLKGCDLLFIHLPSAHYTPAEVGVIIKFIDNGGALFLVMDSDYWSTLEQTNVNDILAPFNLQFGGMSPEKLPGGKTTAGVITKTSLKISYHEARVINGGTPFCYSVHTNEYPFGTFMETKNGGRIIVMGEGMVSLYMTSWEGVNDYQCQEFMQDAFRWLYKM
jgi:hypothetical protein